MAEKFKKMILVMLLLMALPLGCAGRQNYSEMSNYQLQQRFAECNSSAQSAAEDFEEVKQQQLDSNEPTVGATIGAGLARLLVGAIHVARAKSYSNEAEEIKQELIKRESIMAIEPQPPTLAQSQAVKTSPNDQKPSPSGGKEESYGYEPIEN